MEVLPVSTASEYNQQEFLSVQNLTKDYGGRRALENISFTLPAGRILGLMGPNGSGKTTFMKIAAGLLKASSGSIRICGSAPGIRTKSVVSFLPDRNILPKWMTAGDALDYYDDYFSDFDRTKAVEMLNFMRLRKEQHVTDMSKGMIEKLNLTLSFSRNAKLFLLDEPLGGVDPVARERIVSTIVRTYSEYSSIIVSTHLVHDIENMFDTVCFIDEGTILLWGNAEELRTENSMSIDQLYVKLYGDRY
jgi:ABC-2 type transport system ATP-binding protein